jgi:predicted RNA-binding Zn-ribbon protein involved in translation (DUF1610 family)
MEWGKSRGSLKVAEHPEYGEVCADCGEPLISESVNEDYEVGRDYYCGNCDTSLHDVIPRKRESRVEINRAPPKPYTLDDIRKEYPRAYLKWTQDEIIASCFVYKQGKADKGLVQIFERQPTVTSSRIGEHLGEFSENLIPESSAIRILGSNVICASCNHYLILTYRRLERISTSLSINILALSKDALSEKINNYKCPECGERALKVPATFGSKKKLRGRRKQKVIRAPKSSKEVKEPWIYADRRNKDEYPAYTERSGKWLIFLKRNEADEMWAKIKAAVEEGKLGSAAKISTNHPASVRFNPKEQVVCVYTYDWMDEKDVRRIRQQLRELGVTWRISYKSDEDTRNLKYRATGHENISKYRE